MVDSALGTGVHVDRQTCGAYFSSAPPGDHQHRIPDVVFTESGGTVREALDVTIHRPLDQQQRVARRRGTSCSAGEGATGRHLGWHSGKRIHTPSAAETYGCLAPAFSGLPSSCRLPPCCLAGWP